MIVTGRVFDISRGCVDDGPGLRTVVFLKGCHLDCPWCHNIEGKSFRPAIAYDINRCIGCRRCLEACPREWPFSSPNAWRDGCLACGRCAEVCPSQARRLVGCDYQPEQLMAVVINDLDFFKGTGGGITFSGGEPLAQPEFLFDIARALKERGVHLAVETSGFWPDKLREKLVEWFDLILFDLKHVESEKFRRVIGHDNEIILDNLKWLMAADVALEVRITLIPGFNDNNSDLTAIANWLTGCDRLPPVRFLPFHRLAVAKQALFGKAYPYAEYDLSEKKLLEAREIFKNKGW
ncbi:MAG: glycyl-radical enzyme activating protein [Deltaproteobacteria bacterium]|nr:MAG: glycyl-radical enzyme activating protein [Deltaproteobacteria bacterium]